uniref:Major sperm protein n=1 Tax=Ditylenchus dipsaci TaxID=166011 RepID=A0A915D8Z1_9BILA
MAKSLSKKSEKSPHDGRKKSVKGWWNKFGRFLSPQDLALVCGSLVVVYLVMGESAELVCDMFTSLPAAVFTYQLLASEKATKTAYEATLCFWILHGTLVVFDHLLHKTIWYFFVKFLLMTAVSSHVLAKIKEDNRKMRHSSSDQSFQSAKEDHVEEILEGFNSGKAREANLFSSFGTSPLLSMESYKHNLIPREIETRSVATQTLSKELKSKKHSRAPPFHLHPSPDRQMSVLAKNKIECRSSNHNRMVMGDRKGDGPPLAFDFTLPSDAETARLWGGACSPDSARISLGSQTGKISLLGHQDSHSMQQIIFEEPFNEVVMVGLANSTQHNLVWALKTNAQSRVVATPTCGFLPKGKMVDVNLVVRDGYDQIELGGIKNDRLVFDYAYVPNGCDSFHSSWLTNKDAEMMRKSLNVVYSSMSGH